MKKIVSFLLLGAPALSGLSACAGSSGEPGADVTLEPTEREASTERVLPAESAVPTEETPTAATESTEPSAEAATQPDEATPAERKLKMTVEGQEISVVLYMIRPLQTHFMRRFLWS